MGESPARRLHRAWNSSVLGGALVVCGAATLVAQQGQKPGKQVEAFGVVATFRGTEPQPDGRCAIEFTLVDAKSRRRSQIVFASRACIVVDFRLHDRSKFLIVGLIESDMHSVAVFDASCDAVRG
jgi:hypothetical protein